MAAAAEFPSSTPYNSRVRVGVGAFIVAVREDLEAATGGRSEGIDDVQVKVTERGLAVVVGVKDVALPSQYREQATALEKSPLISILFSSPGSEHFSSPFLPPPSLTSRPPPPCRFKPQPWRPSARDPSSCRPPPSASGAQPRVNPDGSDELRHAGSEELHAGSARPRSPRVLPLPPIPFPFPGAVAADDRRRRGCSPRWRSREAAAGDVKRIYGIVARSRPYSWQETLYSEAVTDLAVPTPDIILPTSEYKLPSKPDTVPTQDLSITSSKVPNRQRLSANSRSHCGNSSSHCVNSSIQ
ncbi:serine/arginine repetitive matrix protein 1 [Triticum aestivum]|uniref:serine/arginine repetitive matrix protein 1 n=1 Tax=Triticum aestivum TaxID=4565 RepID=UPI001D02F395|nr:serine/arginine repetitive matrix protein 1-like [Triticum aestivum]